MVKKKSVVPRFRLNVPRRGRWRARRQEEEQEQEGEREELLSEAGVQDDTEEDDLLRKFNHRQRGENEVRGEEKTETEDDDLLLVEFNETADDVPLLRPDRADREKVPGRQQTEEDDHELVDDDVMNPARDLHGQKLDVLLEPQAWKHSLAEEDLLLAGDEENESEEEGDAPVLQIHAALDDVQVHRKDDHDDDEMLSDDDTLADA